MKNKIKVSPSGLYRVVSCPASPQAEALANPNGERRSSRVAAEGTVAHELCDTILNSGGLESAIDYKGDKFSADGFTFEVNDEMAKCVDVYEVFVDECLMSGDDSAWMQSEVWGDLTDGGIDALKGGVTDCLIFDEVKKKIFVIDFKYGAGIAVEATDNSQLQAYALAVIFKLMREADDKLDLYEWDVMLCIVQPRAYHIDGPIRQWRTNAGDILSWFNDDVKPKLIEAQGESPSYKPTPEGCRFCSASGNCSAQLGLVNEMAIVDFEDECAIEPVAENLPAIVSLTPQQIVNIHNNSKLIKKFVDDASSIVLNSLLNDESTFKDSLKLVHGRGARKLDAVALDTTTSPFLTHLEYDDVFVVKQNSMTSIEKQLKLKIGDKNTKELMSKLTTKFKGKPTVVGLTDKRARYVAPNSTEEDFKNMD